MKEDPGLITVHPVWRTTVKTEAVSPEEATMKAVIPQIPAALYCILMEDRMSLEPVSYYYLFSAYFDHVLIN